MSAKQFLELMLGRQDAANPEPRPDTISDGAVQHEAPVFRFTGGDETLAAQHAEEMLGFHERRVIAAIRNIEFTEAAPRMPIGTPTLRTNPF